MILPNKTREILGHAFEQMLGRDGDRSQNKNGVGFNKYDSKEIHKDFDGKPDVTDDILIKHAYRLRKYEKRLIEIGFEKDELKKAIDEVCKPRSIASKCLGSEGKQAFKGQAGRPKQPEYRKINPDGIHPKLKAMKAWACWKSIPNPGKKKPDKVPFSYQINPLTGQEEVLPADCTRPETWMTFEDAMRLLKSSSSFKGLQLALLPSTPTNDEDRLIVLDLDEALLPDGTLKPEVMEWILKFNTRFELSPGDGVRGFCFGHFDPEGGKHTGNIEIYQERKWVTVTGQWIKDSAEDINSAQDVIDEFRAQYFKPYYTIDTSDLPVTNVKFTDDEIINQLENVSNAEIRDQFKHYFYTGPIGNHSDDDFHLCCMIRFWTQDEEQIDRLFRRSALMREKWDEMRGPITYSQKTIRSALGSRTKDTPIYMRHVIEPIPESIDFETFTLEIPGFVVDPSGIYSIKSDGEGNEIKKKIANVPCVITAKGVNQDTKELVYKLLIRDGAGQDKAVWRRSSGLLKKTGVLELMEFGLEFQESDWNNLSEYFFRLITRYRSVLPMETVASRSGWKDNYAQFVIGNKVVTSEGVFDILQIDNDASEFYPQAGDVHVFASEVDPVLKYTTFRFKAYAAVGCLLLRKIDIANYIFDQCCGSGRLKSFSNKLIAAFFGHPKKQQLDPKSTKLGIQKIAEACNDLPIFLDESSDNLAAIMELVYWFNNANTRVKSNQQSGLEISENFCSGLFITGEDSIVTELSKGGHHARRVAETHGVPSLPNGDPVFVPEEIKSRVKRAMNNNYGHIGILFIQKLLKAMPNIENLYSENFKKLPDTGNNILAGRLKEYYTVILTAGYILEEVFADLGMTPRDPLEIVNGYFEENVLNRLTEDDSIKLFRMAYDMYVAHKAHFGATAGSEYAENEKIDLNEKYGWVDTKNGVTIINFRPQALKNFVVKSLGTRDAANRYETALNQWKEKKYINVTVRKDKKTGKEEILKTCQIRTACDDRQNAIQVPLENFYIYLGLEDPEGGGNGDGTGDKLKENGDGREDEQPQEELAPTVPEPFRVPKVAVPSPTSSSGFNQVTNITAGLDEGIILHKGGDDTAINGLLYELGLSGDGQQ